MDRKFYLVNCPGAVLKTITFSSEITSLDYIKVPEVYRRQGIGIRLIKTCLSQIKKEGIDRVTAYFSSSDAVIITFMVALEAGVEILPRFCVEQNDNHHPSRFRTKEEIYQQVRNFMGEFGYKKVSDIPDKTRLKNFGRINCLDWPEIEDMKPTCSYCF